MELDVRGPAPNPSPQGGGGLRGGIVVLPMGNGNVDVAIASLDLAATVSLGDFASVTPLVASLAGPPRKILLAAAERAAAEDFDWLLVLSAAETLAPDVLAKLQPALRVYDAIWGGAGFASPAGSPPPKLERITRLAAQDFPTFFHAALRWWIGPAHFVRPALALEALRAADTSTWYADYMLNLWKRGNAYKTAQCMTYFYGALPLLADIDRARLVAYLEAEPVFMRLHHGDRLLSLPYTGLNPVIEREQMRGLFFEQEELDFLAARFPRGLRIADVGANTGNHTLFFAAIMQAARVIPIEPLPRSAAAIRAVVAENGLANVDLSRLGTAVGEARGRLRPVLSVTAGLGATHFVPDSAGEIPVAPLDELLSGPVDLIKIDVEGMEMQALSGAAGLIATQHPALYVEVVDETVGEFMAWVDRNGYCVEKLFPDKTHCNYLLVAREK